MEKKLKSKICDIMKLWRHKIKLSLFFKFFKFSNWHYEFKHSSLPLHLGLVQRKQAIFLLFFSFGQINQVRGRRYLIPCFAHKWFHEWGIYPLKPFVWLVIDLMYVLRWAIRVHNETERFPSEEQGAKHVHEGVKVMKP